MFYNVDILNRRNGKFAVIWMAANNTLNATAKGKMLMKDLRLFLKVKIGQTCEDIQQYVIIPHSQKMFQDSSRFSLYLSAMLCHGTIIIHHRQVKQKIAKSMLEGQKKLQKNPDVDLSSNHNIDLQTQPGNQLLNSHATLNEQEFYQLDDVVEKLRIHHHGSHHSARSDNGLVTPDRIALDFTENLEAAFNAVQNDPNGHFAREAELTMREVQEIPADTQELMANETFNAQGTLMDWDNLSLPNFAEPMEPMDIDGNLLVVENCNSKRVHDRGPDDDAPSNKQIRTEAEREPDDMPIAIALPAQEMEIDLEPVYELPLRGRGRRPRRLVIDDETVISNREMKRQRENYEDTLRDLRSEYIIPRFVEFSGSKLLSRPSSRFRRSPFLPLFLKHMQIRPTDIDEFEPHQEMPRHVNEVDVAPVAEALPVPTIEPNDGAFEQYPQQSVPLNHFQPVEESAYATLSEMAISSTEMPSVQVDEFLRPGLSTENSFAGSITALSNSRVDVSAHEAYAAGQNKDVLPSSLSTVKEATFEESAISNRLTKSSVVNKRTVANKSLDVAENVEPISAPPLPERRRKDIPETPNYEPIPESSVVLALISEPEINLCPVNVPVQGDLINRIRELTGNMSRLTTFHDLVPPTQYSRMEAANVFEILLGLHKQGIIEMDQDLSRGKEIYIALKNAAVADLQ